MRTNAADNRAYLNARKHQLKTIGRCVNHIKRLAVPGKKQCQVCLWNQAEQDLRKFGLTIEDYARMEYKQKRCCAICFRPEPTGRALAVDHDHQTGHIRGLLCSLCNRGLGCFRDSPTYLGNALTYLGA